MVDGSEVPGPPRARRPVFEGDLVERARALEEHGGGLVDLARLLVDVGWVSVELAVAREVPARPKLAAAVVAAAAALGARRARHGATRAVVAVGGAAMGTRALLRGAGYEAVHRRWRGSAEGLAVVLGLAGVEGARSGR